MTGSFVVTPFLIVMCCILAVSLAAAAIFYVRKVKAPAIVFTIIAGFSIAALVVYFGIVLLWFMMSA